MEIDPITWRQTTSSRWVGRNTDGYSLRLAGDGASWKWSVHPPGAGYSVSNGVAETKDAAVEASVAALRALQAEIARSFEAGLLKRRKRKE